MTRHNDTSGYTLVELVVAVGLFAFIMTLISGAYIMMMNLDRRAQGIAIGIDNLSFALETMTRTIRTGTGYSCDGSGDCNGGTILFVTNGGSVGYSLVNGVIMQTKMGVAVPLTDPSVTVSSLTFYVSGTGRPPADYRQPYVTIVVSGTVSGARGKPESFTIETGAAQRIIDL